MIFIKRPGTDPYFNLAAEEYFLKHRDEDIVMIWQSSPVIVVGKHQNTMAEINLEWVRKNNVPVIRRISGGGTVYHDEGNLNYTVIRSEARKDRLIDFKTFTKPVIDFLNQFGIKAKFEGKNNLVIGNSKFSGNSAHVYKNRIIHHGTLLYNTNLDNLNNSINSNFIKIEDKAVQSIRSKVTNITDHLKVNITQNDFKTEFEKYIHNYFSISYLMDISMYEKKAIYLLVGEKYKTWEWNFGYSPAYTLHAHSDLINQGLNCRIKVENGIIRSITINAPSEKDEKLTTLLQQFVGLPHNPDNLDPYIRTLTKDENELTLVNNLLFNLNV